MRGTYWMILLGTLAALIAYMGLGPIPLDSKVIAWLVVGLLGGSFLCPYSTYWYISFRMNRLKEQENAEPSGQN